MDVTLSKIQQQAIAALRIVFGGIFLTAGIEKAFMASEPWTAAGFLKFATLGTPVLGKAADGVVYNPTHDFWVSLAGNATVMPFVNWLVVFGELAIGVALILGLATRFASVMGTVMMLFFLVAAWSFENGILNEHLAYAVVVAFLGIIGAGRFYGIDAILDRRPEVAKTPQLRYVLE